MAATWTCSLSTVYSLQNWDSILERLLSWLESLKAVRMGSLLVSAIRDGEDSALYAFSRDIENLAGKYLDTDKKYYVSYFL